MTRRKAVPTLRTRRKGERVHTSSGDHVLYDGTTFVELLKTLNREGVTDWDARGRRVKP